MVNLISHYSNTCFDLMDSAEYKNAIDEFLKTFIGHYREQAGWTRE